MKKLIPILLLAFAAIPFQNCSQGGDDPVLIDTTKTTKPEPINTFKFNGITTYNLKWDSTNMFGTYRSTDDMTTILVQGYSNSKYAEFTLKFPGNKIGSFKHSVTPETEIEVVTGTGAAYKQYVFATGAGKDMSINITKFDPIGGRIKGTFSGNLQSSGSLETATITAGAFEVRREQ